jgi:hypothetical protein
MIAALATSMLVAIIWTTAAALAIALLWRGARGRLADSSSRCAACRYIIIEKPRRPEACPECGTCLLGPGRVHIGRRVVARGSLAAGAAVLAACAVPLAFILPRSPAAPIAATVATAPAPPLAPLSATRALPSMEAALASLAAAHPSAPARDDAVAPSRAFGAIGRAIDLSPPLSMVAQASAATARSPSVRDPVRAIAPIDTAFTSLAGASDWPWARPPIPRAEADGPAAGAASARGADRAAGHRVAVERVRSLRSDRTGRSDAARRSGAVERVGR